LSAPAISLFLASLHRRPVLLAFVVATVTLCGWVPMARSEDLSFEAAHAILLAKSDQLKAAGANINRQEFEVSSTRSARRLRATVTSPRRTITSRWSSAIVGGRE